MLYIIVSIILAGTIYAIARGSATNRKPKPRRVRVRINTDV